MSAEEFVDDGSRYGDRFIRLHDSGDECSQVQRRAEQSQAGAWNESLNLRVFGADKWTMPGFGDKGPKCGEYYPEAVCNECGELEFGTHSCGRRGCPECYGLWARGSAMNSTLRVQAFRYTQPDDWHRQVLHAVSSPPEGSVRSFNEFKDAWRRAYKLAEEKGMRGGVVVPHPWRVDAETKQEYRRQDPDVGIWVWIRQEFSDSWRDHTYWSPHFHIIGFSTPDMEPGDKDKDEGWVWRVIRSLSPFDGVRDQESASDVYGCLRYLLSHTGFRTDEDMKSVRYFGCLAPTSFTKDDQPSDGILSRLERTIEEMAGGQFDDRDDGPASQDEDEETEKCPCDGCDGDLIGVFDIPHYLEFYETSPKVRKRMRAAHDWRLGRIRPPPGLCKPTTEEQARETFEALL